MVTEGVIIMKRTHIFFAFLLSAAVVLKAPGTALAQTSDISLQAVEEIQQVDVPFDINTYDATTASEVITLHDKDRLKFLGMKLSPPLFAPKVSVEEAINIASAKSPKFAKEASSIEAEYQLFSYPFMNAFTEEALIRNSQLKKDGFLLNTPVYIVTFFDIKGTGHAMKGKEAPTYSQFNVVIDANSGKSLLSFTYR
ncbi:Peptidase propeptide and YPEB domain-containing protein [Paenibacillus sp. PDC88]|nr:Peptidase propeptide and YPEB domain-containing protein [Paenibacillus sp. PDC88]